MPLQFTPPIVDFNLFSRDVRRSLDFFLSTLSRRLDAESQVVASLDFLAVDPWLGYFVLDGGVSLLRWDGGLDTRPSSGPCRLSPLRQDELPSVAMTAFKSLLLALNSPTLGSRFVATRVGELPLDWDSEDFCKWLSGRHVSVYHLGSGVSIFCLEDPSTYVDTGERLADLCRPDASFAARAGFFSILVAPCCSQHDRLQRLSRLQEAEPIIASIFESILDSAMVKAVLSPASSWSLDALERLP